MVMKQELQIEAVVEQPQLLEAMVAKLVSQKAAPVDTDLLIAPPDWKAAEVASVETYAGGYVTLDDENMHIAMPFITHFFFSCLKDEKGTYKVEWSNSMS